MLNVFITVDTEVWPRCEGPGHPHFDREFRRDVFGVTNEGEFGIGFQMDLLSKHGLKGVFLVEAFFADVHGMDRLAEVVQCINDRGHDVQLHLHTSWLKRTDAILPGSVGHTMNRFNPEDQIALVAHGLKNLQRAGAKRVCAFRAGDYGADFDTLRALARNGLLYDTSHNAGWMGETCFMPTDEHLVQPRKLHGVYEFPVSVFRDFPGHYRHAQLTACSSREIEAAMLAAWKRGWYAFVIVSHSFELIHRSKHAEVPAIPDRVAIRRFERLCHFLAGHRDQFRTAVFSELDPESIPEIADTRPLRSHVIRTAGRMVEQIARRRSVSRNKNRAISSWVRAAAREVPGRKKREADVGAAPAIRPTRLTFRLAGVPIYSATRSLVIKSAPLQMRNNEKGIPAAEMETWPESVDGVLWRSHPVERRRPRHSRSNGALRYVISRYERYYVDLQESFEAYLSRMSSKSRATLKRKVKRFQSRAGGSIDLREYRDGSSMREFHRIARDVSSRTYQDRLLRLGLPDGAEARRAMCGAAERGDSRGYILFARGRAAAFLYAPIADGVVRYEHVGYDPAFATWSPGTVLQYHVLRRLFEEGRFRLFDFCPGEGRHKSFFATGSVRCADVFDLRPTPRNRALVALHSMLDRLESTAGTAFEWSGLKRKVRKWIRTRSERRFAGAPARC